MLSRFVLAFLPRSKHLLIFIAAVTICSDFRAPKIKPYKQPRKEEKLKTKEKRKDIFI